MKLEGLSIIGSEKVSSGGASFHAFVPVADEILTPEYSPAGRADVESAAHRAAQAFSSYGSPGGKGKAELLDTTAAALEARNDIVERAPHETGLPRAETARHNPSRSSRIHCE